MSRRYSITNLVVPVVMTLTLGCSILSDEASNGESYSGSIGERNFLAISRELIVALDLERRVAVIDILGVRDVAGYEIPSAYEARAATDSAIVDLEQVLNGDDAAEAACLTADEKRQLWRRQILNPAIYYE
jgi:hypothetical protein